jgi:hypothetical protein
MTVHYNMLVYQDGLADMQNKLYAAIYALPYAKLSKNCLADVHIEIPVSYTNIKLICVHPYMHTYVIFKGRIHTKLNSSASVHPKRQGERYVCL